MAVTNRSPEPRIGRSSPEDHDREGPFTIMMLPMVVRAQTGMWDLREKWNRRDEQGLEAVALLLIILAVAVIVVVVVLLAVRSSVEGVTDETTNQLDNSVKQFE